MKKSRCYSFTLNNPSSESYAFLEGLGKRDGIIELIYQLEEGEKRRTPHLQGCIIFNNARLISSVIKLLPGAHIEAARKILALKQYCKKNKSRIGKTYHFKNGVFHNPDLFLRKDEFIIKKENLYPWQAKVEEIFLSKPDDRSVYYFYEVEGNTGKSSLISYLQHHYSNHVFSTAGRPADTKYGFAKRIQAVGQESIRVVIWDIPRLLRNSKNNQLKDDVFLTAEQFKNGRFYSEKYDSIQVSFAVPHVFIFTNIKPSNDTFDNALSKDRWKIFQIKNKNLTQFKKPEDF